MNRNRRLIFFLILALLLPYGEIAPAPAEADVIADTKPGEAEWNIRSIRAESSYKDSRKGKKIRVALLDSGVDVDDDIPCEERRNFLKEEEEEQGMLFDDVSGHGTAIAGLICARENEDRITGLAANVELYSAKVFDEDNQAPVSRIARAIQWAVKEKVDIIHMSFGTDHPSPELEKAVKDADKKGILLVAAAGNGGNPAEEESTVEYPAAYDEVLAVGATDTENRKAAWSSDGSEVDLLAPGDRILSTGAFGGIAVEDGTSLAAAHVTGVAAALWGKDRTKSSRFIRALLEKSANSSVTGTEETDEGKAGLLDYTKAKANYNGMSRTYTGLKSRGVSDRHAVGLAERYVRGSREDTAPDEAVNYVNGSWGKTKHQSMIKREDTCLSDADIKLVKKAAAISDELAGLKSLSTHPCFHGGSNYIANTEYLFYLSKNYKAGKVLPTYKNVFFLQGEKVYEGVKANADIRKELKKKTLNSLFKACGVSSKSKKKADEKKRRLVFLGLAVHNATDTLSHRACKNFMAYDRSDNEKDDKNCYDWGPIVHPNNRIKNKMLKGRSVETVWKDLEKNTTDKNQTGKIINYTRLINELAIADELKPKGNKKAMPVSLVKLSGKIAKELVGKWGNDLQKGKKKQADRVKESLQKIADRFFLTASCWVNTLEKGVKKIIGEVALADLSYYWNRATGTQKKWKLNHTLELATLPELNKDNLHRVGEGTEVSSIEFIGNQTSKYIAYTKTGKKKLKRLAVVTPKADQGKENEPAEIKVTISQEGGGNITQKQVTIVAYRNLHFMVQTVEIWRTVSYETKNLEKNIHKAKKMKKKEYEKVTQNIWDHRKKGYKIPKKIKYRTDEKNKKQAGYILNPTGKKKKGTKKKLGDKIPWGVGTNIVLYPYFTKQTKSKQGKSKKKTRK